MKGRHEVKLCFEFQGTTTTIATTISKIWSNLLYSVHGKKKAICIYTQPVPYIIIIITGMSLSLCEMFIYLSLKTRIPSALLLPTHPARRTTSSRGDPHFTPYYLERHASAIFNAREMRGQQRRRQDFFLLVSL